MDEKLKRPSRAEEKKINGDIKNDPDTFEASGDDFAKSKPASKVLPRVLYQEVIKRRNGRLNKLGFATRHQSWLSRDQRSTSCGVNRHHCRTCRSSTATERYHARMTAGVLPIS